jgi:DUF4097 and DUF4098 domain-containing protein YvlB
MRTAFLTAAALAGLAATAAPAAAQPPDERIRVVTRSVAATERATMYQRGGEEQTDRQTKSFKVGERGDVDVSNIAGNITVVRGSGSEATIETIKRSRGRTADEAREMLALVQVEVTERNGHIEVRTQYPRGDESRRNGRRNINVSVDVNITAPAATRVVARSISGNMKATDIKGDLSLETISGTVTISGANRIANAKSISGDIAITDTQADGGIDASSVSGTVALRKVKARGIDLGSVSGDIVVQDVECDRADLHSFSGNVDFGGSFSRNGRYDMKSHSGDIRIGLGGTTGFDLEASTFSGSVRADLPIQTTGTEPASDRGSRRRALRGTYGDGSAILAITTFSGDVVIAKR